MVYSGSNYATLYGAKIACEFGPRNTIFVCPGVKQANEIRDVTNPSLYERPLSNFVHNRYTRKLMNECHGIFLKTDKLTKDVSETLKAQNIMKISQKYRSVLIACLEDLDAATATSSLTEEIITDQKIMFTEIELVWSLIEVLIFDTQSRSIILYRLLDWIQWHFLEPAKCLSNIMSLNEPWEHPDYWNTIFQYVLQGNINHARSLLKSHKFRTREDFLSMDELLRKMPMYSNNINMSWNEFLMRWRHWQDECSRRLSQQDFAAIEELEKLAKILCGDNDILNEKSSLCGTWYHLLISVLLYTDPCISAANLGILARAYSNNMNVEVTKLDKMILAIFELDIIGMINSFCLFNDDHWFVTHITDLLYRGNFLNSDSISQALPLRESLILNYVESLMTHPSLWRIGVDYLDCCDKNGREILEMYLERIPLNSELKAKKILHLAKERNMEELAKSICKVMTARAIRLGMYGTALSWVIESKDVRFATDLANRWIKEYSEIGKFHCFEILRNLGFCMLVSDKLTFLGKYCEFHNLYQEKEFKSAATLLVSLLSSGLVPKPFQMIMLLDSVPLLEQNIPVFTMQETTKLMACLESLSHDNITSEQKEDMNSKKKIIRLALARNLSRAFLHENSSIRPDNSPPKSYF